MGGYSAHGSAVIRRLPNCRYRMWFTFVFDDMYNWDVGKGIQLFGVLSVPDYDLGRLHLVGLAHEYHMTGQCRIMVEWCPGERFGYDGEIRKQSTTKRRSS